MHEPIDVLLLGPVLVATPSRSVPVAGRKARTLLARLALTPGRVVPRELLVDDLWPAAAPARAFEVLRVHMSNLRGQLRALGGSEYIGQRAGGWSLDIADDAVDAARYATLVLEGQRRADEADWSTALARFQAAAALWRDQPFADVEPGRGFDTTFARLTHLATMVDAGIVTASLALGRGALLVSSLQATFDVQPDDERAAADLAQALYQAGRAVDALEVVRLATHRAADRGLAPTPALAALEGAILRHELPVGVTTPTALVGSPPAPTSLIGRAAELEQLDAAIRDASARSLLVVTGEAGIGKTALVDEWIRRTRGSATVVRGQCSPEGVVPFEAFAALGVGADAIERDPYGGHDAYFAAVSDRLDACAVGATTALVIDDLQWLGADSVALLRHLLAADAGSLIVVATGRDPELRHNPAVAALCADLMRRHAITEIALGALSSEAATELAQRCATSADVDAARIAEVGAGQPLFVTELARAGWTEADPLPKTVAAVLDERLRHLDRPAQAVLGIAAILGPTFDVSRVIAVADVDALDAISALETATGERLLVETNTSFAFAHELARNAVLTHLSASRRAHLHARVAQTYLADSPIDPFRVAHHLCESVPTTDPIAAARAALRAANAAIATGGFGTASAWAARADRLLVDHEPIDAARSDEARRMRCDIRLTRAIEGLWTDASNDARPEVESVFETATRNGWHEIVVRSIIVLHSAGHSFALEPRHYDAARLAVEHVREHGTARDLVDALWALVQEARFAAEIDLSSVASEARARALATDDTTVLLRAEHVRQIVGQLEFTDPTLVREWADEGIALAERSGNLLMSQILRGSRTQALIRAGALADAYEEQARIRALAIHNASARTQGPIEAREVVFALCRDDLDRAEELAHVALRSGEPSDLTMAVFGAHLVAIAMGRGTLGTLRDLTNAAARSGASIAQWFAALTEVADGAVEAARDRVGALAAGADPARPPHWLWTLELAAAAHTCYIAGWSETAVTIARRIEPYREQWAVGGGGASVVLGPMDAAYGLALAAAGRSDAAVAAFDRAVASCDPVRAALWVRLCEEHRAEVRA